MGSSGSSTGSSAPSPISSSSSTSSPVRVVAAVVLKVKVGLLARVVATLVKWQTRSTGGAKRRVGLHLLGCPVSCRSLRHCLAWELTDRPNIVVIINKYMLGCCLIQELARSERYNILMICDEAGLTSQTTL